MTATTDSLTPLREALMRYWGYSSFRPLQAEAMQAVVENRDSLVVLPTGGGKSICFQAPAMTMPGLAVVVSPLISLMKDQVDALIECGIPAACVNSTQTAAERQQIAQSIRTGNLKLLYIAPERLCSDKMLGFLQGAPLSFFAIDEAHCISNWGHDFRPEYRMLRQLRDLFPQVAVHAYTATATEQVRQDIIEQLGLNSADVLVGSFDRPNLTYRVVRRNDVTRQVRSVIDQYPEESGIVYCITRKEVDELAGALQLAGYKVRPYHAGLSDQDRHKHQDEFLNDEVQIVVATVAFGMGIDKSNVRYVVHTGAPKSLEHYQQETGRAGRDGLESGCWLIWTAANFVTWRKMLSDLPREALAQADASLRSMERFCNGVVCRHKVLVEHFNQTYPQSNCGACDVCLEQLDEVADPMVLGQKILSCVFRVKESFGAEYVAQVLTGSQEARIIDNRHDQLSTYGLLKEEKKIHVREWIEQLASQGYLERVGEYNTLKVTQEGWRVLRGETAPRLLKPVKKKATKASAGQLASWEGVDSGLFETLRKLRRQIAGDHNVPPFIVFSDTTLRDMARRRPATLEGFRLVHGVGDKKTTEYGEVFTQAIASYCQKHGVVTDVLPGQTSGIKPAREFEPKATSSSPARHMAFDLFRQGKSIDSVAAIVGRAASTVSEYLAEFIDESGLSDPEPWVDAATFERIQNVRHLADEGKLKPVYDALNGEVSYDVLRIAFACLRYLPAKDPPAPD